MSDQLPILIVTHGRAGNVLTRGITTRWSLCVSESQKARYEAFYPDDSYITHPDSVVGLAQKRQWIIQNVGDVMMLDDDIPHVADLTTKAGEKQRMSPERVTDAIDNLYQMTKEAGLFLFGFVPIIGPWRYNPFLPFWLKGQICGHCHGVIAGSKLYYAAEVMTDDDWIGCLNAHYNRICLIDSRYGFANPTMGKSEGGLGGFRTSTTAEKSKEQMRRYFGTDVIQDAKKSYDASGNVIVRGRTLMGFSIHNPIPAPTG